MATILQKYVNGNRLTVTDGGNYNDRVGRSRCGRSVATSRSRGHDTRTLTPTSRWTFSANSSRTNSIEICFRRSTTSRSSPGLSVICQSVHWRRYGASDLPLNGREFDPRPPRYRSVGNGMGDFLQAGIPPRYVTSQIGQLSLLPSVGRKMTTKVRGCSVSGSKGRMAHSVRG